MNKVKLQQNVVVQLLKKQGGCCAICDKEFSSTPISKDQRRLICVQCNDVLDYFDYDPGRLHKALDYIRG